MLNMSVPAHQGHTALVSVDVVAIELIDANPVIDSVVFALQDTQDNPTQLTITIASPTTLAMTPPYADTTDRPKTSPVASYAVLALSQAASSDHASTFQPFEAVDSDESHTK